MTTVVNEEKVIKLVDGTEVTIRPLKVSLLRKFMAKFETIGSVADSNEKSLDVMLACVQIAMQQYKPELSEDLATLEDNIDLPTVYKIIEEAAGITLDPNTLMGTAATANTN
jgi:hypothetical protein